MKGNTLELEMRSLIYSERKRECVLVCASLSAFVRRGCFQRHKSPARLRCLMFYCAKPRLYKISRLTLEAGD